MSQETQPAAMPPVLDPNTRAIALAVLLSEHFAKWAIVDDTTLASAGAVVDRIESWAVGLPIAPYVARPPIPAAPGAYASSISLLAPPPESGAPIVPHPIASAPQSGGPHATATPVANTTPQNPGGGPVMPSNPPPRPPPPPAPAGHASTPVGQPLPPRAPRFAPGALSGAPPPKAAAPAAEPPPTVPAPSESTEPSPQ